MKRVLCIILAVLNGPLLAQWAQKNVFEPHVVIENKGQYVLPENITSEKILFGARVEDLHYYFTPSSIIIKHLQPNADHEVYEEMLGKNNLKGDEQESEKRYSLKALYYQMKFVGAGTKTSLDAQEKVAQQFNFTTQTGSAVVTDGYRKLIYKDLYPGIDMEFYFPDDKPGYKYSFIVHKGADPSLIKMKFPLANKIRNKEGNLVISSSFGQFTDHAPESSQKGKQITSAFNTLKNGEIGFAMGNYSNNEDLIIDPWTTTPGFSSGNQALDVDWDNVGNCYVYGGSSPFQVLKFSPSGSALWSYTTAFASGTYYGDFAVDKSSGSVYIVDGFNSSGAQIIKLNHAGAQVAMFMGNAQLQEMWRVSFDMCNQRPVIGGGGTSSPSFTGCTLDTNLANVNPVNIFNAPTGLHDIWGLALDPNGNAYFASARTQVGSPGYDNTLFKVPNPSLSPITYSTATTYSFIEVASVIYAPSIPNGYNGMAVSDTNVFLYDSYVLTRFNAGTGVATGSISINGASQSTMTCGGLASDGCNNLFLGLSNSVKQYDASFNLINTFAQAGTVFDVNLGNGTLYTCGQGFVSAAPISLNPCNPCIGGIGVKSYNAPDILVYPNPSQGVLSVELPGSITNASIHIYNSLGERVQEFLLKETKSKIELHNIPNGVYSMEIAMAGKVVIKKIVVSNP